MGLAAKPHFPYQSRVNVDIVNGLEWYVVFLFSTCCHEAAHAWSALRLGDDTASRGGQVTLNPVPHIEREPVGMVVVPILSYVLGGWMMGWASAPYDPHWAMRYPRRCAWMSLAGPAANLLLVLAAILLMRLGCEWNFLRTPIQFGFERVVESSQPDSVLGTYAATMLSLVFSLNLLLGVFNLLPLPPLDGSQIPLLFLRSNALERYWVFVHQPSFVWLGIFVAWRVMDQIDGPLFFYALKFLYSLMPGR